MTSEAGAFTKRNQWKWSSGIGAAAAAMALMLASAPAAAVVAYSETASGDLSTAG